MAQQTIAELDKRLEQLRLRKAKLVAREGATQRRIRTRQAVILGAWMLSHRPDWVAEAKSLLDRPQDLAVFGCAPVTVDIPLDDLDAAAP